MNKQLLSKLAAVIITISIIAILFSQIGIGDVYKKLSTIKPIYLIIGFVLYIISYFLRALRFYFLLNKEVSIKDLFTITCIHNMTNNILPARTGELSYIYLLKKHHNTTVGEGAATLIMARMFDIITISLLFITSTMFIQNLPSIMMKAFWGIAFFVAAIVPILIMLLYRGIDFIHILRKIAIYLKLNKIRYVDYIFLKMAEMAESFSRLHQSQLIWNALISVGIWLALYSMNFTLVKAMGINLTFEIVILASTFTVLTTILPIQGIAGFGTIEGGWTIGFLGLGVAKDVAISSGFSYHIIFLLYSLILGCWGLIKFKYSNSF